MKPIQTVEDVYLAIDQLIAELNLGNHAKLAGILHHRMHEVSWTTGPELFHEMHSVLTKALQSEYELPEPIRNQMQQIVNVIGELS